MNLKKTKAQCEAELNPLFKDHSDVLISCALEGVRHQMHHAASIVAEGGPISGAYMAEFARLERLLETLEKERLVRFELSLAEELGL